MGNIELSLMKKTILVLRDWDAFQVTCRQGLKLLRADGGDSVRKQSTGVLEEKGVVAPH